MKKSETKKLDDIWRVKIKENAGHKCEIDGTLANACQLHSHHFIGRRNKATRWYLPNGVCLSALRHKLSVWSAHENPEYFRKEMLDIRGQKWLNDLTRRANMTFKGSFQSVKDYLDGKTDNY